MKISEKMKKNLMIAGGTMIAVVLIGIIGSQFNKSSQTADVAVSSELEETIEVEVIPKTEKEEVAVTTMVAENKELETEPETLSPQTDLPEQVIQPEVPKPAEPSEEQKTNPYQKPNGETVTETLAVKHEEVVAPTTAPPVEEVVETEVPAAATPTEQHIGESNDNNKVNVPGFGWVEGSGDTQVIEADDMYENGNKIGIMD